jgi:hypothetical protein
MKTLDNRIAIATKKLENLDYNVPFLLSARSADIYIDEST